MYILELLYNSTAATHVGAITYTEAKLQLPLRCCLGCTISPVSIALVLSSVDNVALIFAAEMLFKPHVFMAFSRPVTSSGDNDLLTSAIEVRLSPHRLSNPNGVLSDLLVWNGLLQPIEMHKVS